jgi:cobalamin biosynthetic protein CobC
MLPTPVLAAGFPVVTDHGGDLGAARLRFREAPEPWLDLSTGINPWPYPVPLLAPEVWQRLPDPATLRELSAVAARAYGAPGPDHVAAAPGSQALIQWLPRLRRPGRVAVLGPTYAEHVACWTAAGHQVSVITETAALYHESWDTVVVVNPNNPDGRAFEPPALTTLAATLAAAGGWLVVDEAFADLDPAASVAAAVGQPGLIVLRSFGKVFGLAGLRLGFGLAEPAVAARLRQALGPWPVSGPAAAIAGTALADRAWMAQTRTRLAEAAGRLDRLLAAHGLTVAGGTALFRLALTGNAAALFEGLGRAGILVRRFEAHPDWLRFGLPASEAAWHRLDRALP